MVLPIAPRHETQVNGHSVAMSGTRLRSGDVIRCGDLHVRFVLLKLAAQRLSIDQRQAQLRNCPTETAQLSVNAASGLTGGGSSMLAGPSGLATSVKARLTYQDRNHGAVVVEIPQAAAFWAERWSAWSSPMMRTSRVSGDGCFARKAAGI